jgi:hypothetical protein
MRIKSALAAILALFAVPACAQQFPTVPDHTVIGRIGIVGQPGPSQAIPFATFQSTFPRSGNGTTFATTTGSLTPGDCVKIDASGNLVDNGAVCITANTPHTQDFLAVTNFTAGTTTSLTLSSAPASPDVLIILFDGVWQNINTWSLSGSLVTFTAAIPLNTQVVEAKWSTSSTLAGVGSIGKAGSPLSGAVTLSSGAGISLTQAGQNIAIATGIPSVTDAAYGAKCDSTTDDTTAINLALSTVPAGGSLLIPALCKVIGSGSAILTRTMPINLICTGMYTSGFLVDSTVPNTRDVLLIQPAPHTVTRGYSITNCGILPNGGTPGRDAIVFDSTSAADTEMADIVLNHLFLQSTVTGAYALHLHNLPANTNGGTFNFTLMESVVVGGVRFDSIGDTIRIRDNLMSGVNAAISGDQIAGAGNLIIDGNNASGTGGGLVLGCAVSPRITNNEFEQQVTSTETNNAIVDLVAGGCTIDNAVIQNNQVQANASIGNPTLVRIGANNSNPIMQGNRFGVPANYACTSNATTTLSCITNSWNGCTTHISGTAALNALGC